MQLPVIVTDFAEYPIEEHLGGWGAVVGERPYDMVLLSS